MFKRQIQPDETGDTTLLKQELDRLSASLTGDHVDFTTFWEKVKQLNMNIQSSTTLRREQCDALRARLNEICAEAKQHRKDVAEKRERRQAISTNKRSLVEMKIHEAHGYAKGGRDADDLRKARALLREAREWLKDGWAGFNATTQSLAFDDGKMTKSDHDACSERWQEANRALNDRQQELGDYNFTAFENDAEDAIGTAENDPKRAREKVQVIQQSMKGKVMSGEQFERVRHLLEKACSRADSESDRRKHEAIRRKKELVGKVMNEIGSLRDQIDHYRGEEANAKTESFAEAMREKIEVRYGWIEEKETFIRELESQIHEIHSQLRH